MPKKLPALLVIPLLLISCLSISIPVPTPTPTPTQTSTSTQTVTPTPSATPQPSPMFTATALPAPASVRSGNEFEEMVKSGQITCQGYASGSRGFIKKFIAEATQSGVLPEQDMLLVSGIPSRDDPEQCLFILYFEKGAGHIVYKDYTNGEFVNLPIQE